MIAFEVSHNGQTLCTAALTDQRLLTFLLTYRGHAADEPLSASTRALPPGDPFALKATEWPMPAVQVGDTIQVRIVEVPPEALTPGEAVEADLSSAPAHVKAALDAMKRAHEQQNPDSAESP